MSLPINENSSHRAEMQMLANKCSICFDHELDFCLIRCQDQFCRYCFTRYAHEVVKNAWGLSAVEMQCPVCRDSLQYTEWQNYVDSTVRALYEKHNRPFKTLIRSCPSCEHDNPISIRISGDSSSVRQQCFDSIIRNLQMVAAGNEKYDDIITQIKDIYAQYDSDGDSCEDVISRIYQIAFDHFFRLIENYELTNTFATAPPSRSINIIGKKRARTISSDLNNLSPNSSHSSIATATESENGESSSLSYKITCLQQASHDIISLQTSNSGWRNLQFMHLSKFSRYTCSNCDTQFCFQCGEKGWHEGVSCLEWMNHIVESTSTKAALIQNRILTRSMSAIIAANGQLPTPTSPTQSLSNTSNETIETLKWKVANSKSCPRCHTLICREEGCNKVDCTMCGYRFCWVCKSSWSEKCGFYRCKEEGSKPDPVTLSTSHVSEMKEETADRSRHESEAENGVPDVRRISVRLS